MSKDVILVGTPETVAEKIERLQNELNCRHVTLWPNPSFLPFEKVYHSLELFAERVIPYFENKAGPCPRGIDVLLDTIRHFLKTT